MLHKSPFEGGFRGMSYATFFSSSDVEISPLSTFDRPVLKAKLVPHAKMRLERMLFDDVEFLLNAGPFLGHARAVQIFDPVKVFRGNATMFRRGPHAVSIMPPNELALR